MLRALLLAVAAAACVGAAAASAQSFDAILAVQKAILELDSVALTQAQLDSLHKLEADIQSLQAALQDSTAIDPEYSSNLQLLASALNLARRTPDPAERLSMMREVDADLALKVRYQRSALGLTPRKTQTVKVTVTTIRVGAPAKGLLVRCNPRAYSRLPIDMVVFNDPTTPTSRELTPGLYVLALIDPASMKEVARRDIEPGADGKDQLGVQFDLK